MASLVPTLRVPRAPVRTLSLPLWALVRDAGVVCESFLPLRLVILVFYHLPYLLSGDAKLVNYLL
jgi:hypothetical protein